MNNEIKEILNRLEKIGFYASVPKELAYMTTNITPQECKTILDYITNLQKRNKELYEGFMAITKELTEYAEENETLKELNVCVGCDNNSSYKQRIEKAIEYINRYKEKLHHSFDEPDCDYWIATNPDDLLHILQNGSDEE